MIIVRLATEEDIDGILDIENDAISPPWTHGFLLKEMNANDSCFFVAEDNTRVLSPFLAGFAVVRQVGDDSELLQIAVDKKVRRQGVGDILISNVIHYAESNVCKAIFLEVRESNHAAIALYAKHGFTSVRNRKSYYSDPVEDAIIMIRSLN